jgi:hypothetical protein
MANLTWAPSPYLLNIPTVSNVTTSATGSGNIATLQSQVNAILAMVDTTNKKIKTNTIGNFSTTPIQVVNAINFAGGVSGVSNLTSSISGSFFVGGGNIYISSLGAPVTCASGNMFCDGIVYSSGSVCPSDIRLKKEIRPYESSGLPTPVRFNWNRTGTEDIGFLANEVEHLVPEAVSSFPNGMKGVDYAKIVVTAVAEIKSLQVKVKELEDQLRVLNRSSIRSIE